MKTSWTSVRERRNASARCELGRTVVPAVWKEGAVVAALLLGMAMAPERSAGQGTQPAPGVQWQHWNAPTNRPPGVYYTWNNSIVNPLYTGTQVPMSPQTLDNSGEDWHYSTTKYYENGVHVGYIACGYSGFKNFSRGSQDGCFTDNVIGGPGLEQINNWSARTSLEYGTITRYDLKGTVVWFRSYLPGTSMG